MRNIPMIMGADMLCIRLYVWECLVVNSLTFTLYFVGLKTIMFC